MSFSRLYDNKESYADLRRSLRKKSTKAEQVFWCDIRNRRLGVIFRRQYQIGYYIADFYCQKLRLIIELDGSVHDEEFKKKHDQKRQRWLESMGYTIFRFSNENILFDRGCVLDILREYIEINKSKL